LLRNLTLGHVGKYFRTIRALAPFSVAPTSFDTTLTLITLHLKSNDYFLFFLENYELNQDLKKISDSFKLAFQCMPHLSANGPFRMIFEHLQDFSP
jgi:hypothetical protein